MDTTVHDTTVHDTPRPVAVAAPPTHRHQPTSPPPPPPTSRTRRVLRAFAIVSCVPYIVLKVLWIAGSELGIPAGSSLVAPENRGLMVAVNSLTILMDAAVVVLALAFTRPWGRRLPAWLLALPAWAAAGLLAPMVVGFPLQLAVSAATGSTQSGSAQKESEVLADWVFGVVYGGFMAQALALGALFLLYARDRWGGLLRGRVGAPATGSTRRLRRRVALAAAGLAAVPATAHLLWACGVTAGLGASGIEDRDTNFYLVEAVHAAYAVMMAAGVLILGLRLGQRAALGPPLAAAWIGSGAVACWGGWLALAQLVSGGSGTAVSWGVYLTYAVQVTSGTLTLLLCSQLLLARGRHPGAVQG